MSAGVYAREPLEVRGSIPLFSPSNDYTENYERIAADHLRAIRERHVANPFDPDELWAETETRRWN